MKKTGFTETKNALTHGPFRYGKVSHKRVKTGPFYGGVCFWGLPLQPASAACVGTPPCPGRRMPNGSPATANEEGRGVVWRRYHGQASAGLRSLSSRLVHKVGSACVREFVAARVSLVESRPGGRLVYPFGLKRASAPRHSPKGLPWISQSKTLRARRSARCRNARSGSARTGHDAAIERIGPADTSRRRAATARVSLNSASASTLRGDRDPAIIAAHHPAPSAFHGPPHVTRLPGRPAACAGCRPAGEGCTACAGRPRACRAAPPPARHQDGR